MAGWSGFTDEELHRLKNSSEASLVEKQKRQNAGQHSIPQHSSTTGNEQRIRPQHRRKMPLKQDGVAKQNKVWKLIHRKINVMHEKRRNLESRELRL